jgi:hypothetical protein
LYGQCEKVLNQVNQRYPNSGKPDEKRVYADEWFFGWDYACQLKKTGKTFGLYVIVMKTQVLKSDLQLWFQDAVRINGGNSPRFSW